MASQSDTVSSGTNAAASPDSTGWTSADQSGQSGSGQYGNESPMEESGVSNMSFLRGFNNPMQKKTTRDGQPAKRRGPKPDSKPAQTRRQELNRQAQRTHRERKEQYIKALEHEISRLRATFVSESAQVEHNVRHSEMKLQEQQQENMLLREILNSRGISFEVELQQRKNALSMGSHANSRGIGPQYSAAQSSAYANMPSMPAQSQASFPDSHRHGYTNGTGSKVSGHSPNTLNNSSLGTYHGNSPSSVQETGGTTDMILSVGPVGPKIRGIFEEQPQLGVDFVLELEKTCRDHGEYLVRRSMNSPNNPEEALFSGHALMASVPPPTHIEKTPAVKGGLQPTYPHQAPVAAMEVLNKLLNLSTSMEVSGIIEGGQVTPISALQHLRGHQNYESLTREDVVGMVEAIRNKVRCYGFGAVMEDFEFRDALAAIFATKPETYATFGHGLTSEIEDMYS